MQSPGGSLLRLVFCNKILITLLAMSFYKDIELF